MTLTGCKIRGERPKHVSRTTGAIFSFAAQPLPRGGLDSCDTRTLEPLQSYDRQCPSHCALFLPQPSSFWQWLHWRRYYRDGEDAPDCGCSPAPRKTELTCDSCLVCGGDDSTKDCGEKEGSGPAERKEEAISMTPSSILKGK